MGRDGDLAALRELVERSSSSSGSEGGGGPEAIFNKEERSPFDISTAFHQAAYKGRVPILEYLWSSSSSSSSSSSGDGGGSDDDHHHRRRHHGSSSTTGAVGLRRRLMAETDTNGYTALMYATMGGEQKVVEWMLPKCTQEVVEAVSTTGSTALHVAVYNGHTAVAELLARAHPSLLPIQNKNGKTAAQLARMAMKGETAELLERLQREPALIPQTRAGAAASSSSSSQTSTSSSLSSSAPAATSSGSAGASAAASRASTSPSSSSRAPLVCSLDWCLPHFMK